MEPSFHEDPCKIGSKSVTNILFSLHNLNGEGFCEDCIEIKQSECIFAFLFIYFEALFIGKNF